MYVHFVGVAGSGMSGLAELAVKAGFSVTGSDSGRRMADSAAASGLIRFFPVHAAENVFGVDLVVRSSAVPDSNIEISTARGNLVPVWSRLEFLEHIFRRKEHRIAVCGSFGKSSTATMMRDVLTAAGLDPSYYIGAVPSAGRSVDLTDSDFSVFEACEYRAEFIATRPTSVIINNIYKNHEDFFGPDLAKQHRLFRSFLKINEPSLNCVALDLSDPGTISGKFDDVSNVATFGTEGANYQVTMSGFSGNDRWRYELLKSGSKLGSFESRWPGEHSAKNMAAVFAVADRHGVSTPDVIRGLSEGNPPARRFAITFDGPNAAFVEDNARLPPQIAATIRAARRRWPRSKLLVVAGIWGRLYPRDLSALALSLALADAVLIPASGGVEEEVGGPEVRNADEKLTQLIAREGVLAICGCSEAEFRSAIETFDSIPTVVITLGYDDNRKIFDEINALARQATRSPVSKSTAPIKENL